ncbi:MAG: hypothetical protein N2376_12975, partial [Clostridia bacterium]|nr:hypothetical protein [Clostridia bacterium]
FIVLECIDHEEENADIVQKLREDRFILIDRDWEDITSLKKCGIPARMFSKEVHVFALSEAYNKNVKVTLGLMAQAKKDRIAEDKLHFYISTSEEGIEKIFETTNLENGTSYEFKVFKLADITARQLFQTYPIHDYIDVDTTTARATSDFNLFIAGLGETSVEILRKSIYLGQFIGGSYRAVVADEDMSRKKGLLFNQYPELKTHYQIETYESQPGSEAFFEVLERNIKGLRYIVVALENDRRNIETAVEIQRLVKRAQIEKDVLIAVHIRKHEEFEHLEGTDILPNVRFFGRSSELFTESIIINESMDRMSRKMNALFNEIYHIKPADNWGTLDAFTKESNRSAAANFATKLHLLGLEMVERGKADERQVSDRKRVDLRDYLTGERLFNLGMQEHLRWNAFHFASGWTTWQLKDTGDSKKAKDLKNKRHACLVTWDELLEVTRHFNQNPSYQDLDFEQVKNIPMILESVGYDVLERED